MTHTNRRIKKFDFALWLPKTPFVLMLTLVTPIDAAWSNLLPQTQVMKRGNSAAKDGDRQRTMLTQTAKTRSNQNMRKQQQVAINTAKADLKNKAILFSNAPILAAKPFNLVRATPTAQNTALGCLAQAIYYEAAFEPMQGRRAVAQVILNRVRHPAFPKSVCGVVYQGSSKPGCQFSFACDGALSRMPNPFAWDQAKAVALSALEGYVEVTVGQATHYHANYVSPYWAPRLAKLTRIGTHIFYRWPGRAGLPQAFSGTYAQAEEFNSASRFARRATRSLQSKEDIRPRYAQSVSRSLLATADHSESAVGIMKADSAKQSLSNVDDFEADSASAEVIRRQSRQSRLIDKENEA